MQTDTCQVEVPDEIKYVQTQDERTTGASSVQNYILWKNRKLHLSLNMNVTKSGHEHTDFFQSCFKKLIALLLQSTAAFMLKAEIHLSSK